jgi:hypothetical protein
MQDLPSDMTEDGELSDAAGEMNPDIRADAEEYDANTPTGAEQGEEDKEDIDPQEEVFIYCIY